jgi:hypothetical protein
LPSPEYVLWKTAPLSTLNRNVFPA